MSWVVTEMEDQEVNLVCQTNMSSLFQQVACHRQGLRAWTEVCGVKLMLSSFPCYIAPANPIVSKEGFLWRMHWKPRKQKN